VTAHGVLHREVHEPARGSLYLRLQDRINRPD